jgi:hypothetical protein
MMGSIAEYIVGLLTGWVVGFSTAAYLAMKDNKESK